MNKASFLMVGSPERAVNLAQVKTAKVDLQGVAHLTMVGEGADMFISFRLANSGGSSYALAKTLCRAGEEGGVWTMEEFTKVYMEYVDRA